MFRQAKVASVGVQVPPPAPYPKCSFRLSSGSQRFRRGDGSIGMILSRLPSLSDYRSYSVPKHA